MWKKTFKCFSSCKLYDRSFEVFPNMEPIWSFLLPFSYFGDIIFLQKTKKSPFTNTDIKNSH